jgi:hypothetical protein
MREQLGRWLATVGVMVALVGGGTGCASFNPKAIWALTEKTPMQTVVRRADVARATANNVERLMSATGVDTDSKWVDKVAVKKTDAEPILKEVSKDPEYSSLTGEKLKVVPAEAWAQILSKVCSTESGKPSLYGEISDDVHSQYADIAAQAKTVGKIKSDISIEEDAIDDKDRADEKADHEKKKADLKEQLEKTEKEYKPKVEAFKTKLAEDAAKASPEAKKQIAAAIASLQHAVDDAKLANTAALLGYPKAFPGLKDEVKIIVKRIAADTIEASIGTRPNLEKLVPEVKFKGGVSVTIAGLSPSDMGKLKLEDAVKDIANRSKDYIVHVVTLLGYISETGELLALQSDMLETAQKAVGGSSGGEDISDLAITAQNAAGASGANKRIAVPMEACLPEKKPAAPEPEPPAAPPAKGKGGKAAPPPPPPAKKKGK